MTADGDRQRLALPDDYDQALAASDGCIDQVPGEWLLRDIAIYISKILCYVGTMLFMTTVRRL